MVFTVGASVGTAVGATAGTTPPGAAAVTATEKLITGRPGQRRSHEGQSAWKRMKEDNRWVKKTSPPSYLAGGRSVSH